MDSGSETPSEVSEKSSQLSGSSEMSSLLSESSLSSCSSKSPSEILNNFLMLTGLLKDVEEVEGDGKV